MEPRHRALHEKPFVECLRRATSEPAWLMTAHVDWDELIAAGESEGLVTEGPVRQGRYLTETGIFDFVDSEAEKWRVYRLVDPAGMGDEISVLVQSHGI